MTHNVNIWTFSSETISMYRVNDVEEVRTDNQTKSGSGGRLFATKITQLSGMLDAHGTKPNLLNLSWDLYIYIYSNII